MGIWHNNPVNGQNQVRQKARAELPFPKYNSEIKKYGKSARLRKNWDRDRPKGQICPRAEKEVSITNAGSFHKNSVRKVPVAQ